MSELGKLRLSVEGTSNGRGFYILYDFGKSHDFMEFKSKGYFHFIQPWMQFPSTEYSDECKLVSIELVRRFNDFTELENRVKTLSGDYEKLLAKYNGVFEWALAHNMDYFDTAEEVKKEYEESLK